MASHNQQRIASAESRPASSMHRSRRRYFVAVIFLLQVGAAFALWGGYVAYRSSVVYQYLKRNERGLMGKVARVDSDLGYAIVPNSLGAMTFPIGDNLPVEHDENGFRIPVGASTEALPVRPVIMALGCSCTYGETIPAEQAFPFLVGRGLGGSVRNAGVFGYGLAQMLILARRLIPVYKPDYLLVQYSPWLGRRARTPFAPSYFGRVPVPYFGEQGGITLHAPLFSTMLFDLPIDKYRGTPPGIQDAASFFWKVGLPLAVHDHFHMAVAGAKSYSGRSPKPARPESNVEQFVYSQIGKTAREHGARMVVVIVPSNTTPPSILRETFPSDVIVVDPHPALLSRLPTKDDATYHKYYCSWRGSPPRMVDLHPNASAHRLIADEILSSLRRPNRTTDLEGAGEGPF